MVTESRKDTVNISDEAIGLGVGNYGTQGNGKWFIVGGTSLLTQVRSPASGGFKWQYT